MKALLFFVIFLFSQVTSFRIGEVIRMHRRSSNDEPWRQSMTAHCPRFGMDKSFHLVYEEEVEYRDEHHLKVPWSMKLSFSFDGDKFITPYFLISDFQTSHLDSIKFKFIYSGDDLIDMKYEAQYADLVLGKKVKSVLIEHTWIESSGKSISNGLATLLSVGFFSGVGVFLYILLDSQVFGEVKYTTYVGVTEEPKFAPRLPRDGITPTRDTSSDEVRRDQKDVITSVVEQPGENSSLSKRTTALRTHEHGMEEISLSDSQEQM
eukprot:TRINITY_DN5931_c0_g1_i1.p1 TRINITY_DN5931_c0_g1~~TRINITY_DN5931_c0_g1_i1.p1  ORF type:complete len:264 (-),score=56.37 TRINITY_DN5931_c0_g1_i1:91-882(-)